MVNGRGDRIRKDMYPRAEKIAFNFGSFYLSYTISFSYLFRPFRFRRGYMLCNARK